MRGRILLVVFMAMRQGLVASDVDTLLKTQIPDYQITNATLEQAVGVLNLEIRKQLPNDNLPVVTVSRVASDEARDLTMQARYATVGQILDILSQIRSRRFLIIDGAVVLREIDHADWITTTETIGPKALKALGLTSESKKAEVQVSLERFGIRFTEGCLVTPVRDLGLMAGETNALKVLMTLEPPDFNKTKGIFRLLEEGFTIDKQSPNKRSDGIVTNVPNHQP